MRKYSAQSLFDFEDDIDLNEFIQPYTKFENELKEHLYFIKNKAKLKAYIITCVGIPEIFFIAFAENRDKAKSKAVKYYRDTVFHPEFTGNAWKKTYTKLRRNRCSSFDKYAKEGKVPIQEILKLGASFNCAICGKHTFTEADYDKHKCFILEGDGDYNSYTQNLIICYDCKRKLESNC